MPRKCTRARDTGGLPCNAGPPRYPSSPPPLSHSLSLSLSLSLSPASRDVKQLWNTLTRERVAFSRALVPLPKKVSAASAFIVYSKVSSPISSLIGRRRRRVPPPPPPPARPPARPPVRRPCFPFVQRYAILSGSRYARTRRRVVIPIERRERG